MGYRILIFAIVVFVDFCAVPSANAEAHVLVGCPFSYELPEEIEPLLNLSSRDREKHSVVWRVSCRQRPPIELAFSQFFCRFEPTPPHRQICNKTSRWNNRDSIIEIKKGWTDITYSAEGPNGYQLFIRAEVKPYGDDDLVEETRQKILKISTSVHVKNGKPPLPEITKTYSNALPELFAVKKDALCPFEFKLPKSYVAKITRFPMSLVYSGQFELATWGIICSNDPSSHTHHKHLLEDTSCYIETTPPHHKICWRSRRWGGTEQLLLSKFDWQTNIQYQAYTSQDQWLLVGVKFDRQADQTMIKKTLEIVQAIAKSVKPVH